MTITDNTGQGCNSTGHQLQDSVPEHALLSMPRPLRGQHDTWDCAGIKESFTPLRAPEALTHLLCTPFCNLTVHALAPAMYGMLSLHVCGWRTTFPMLTAWPVPCIAGPAGADWHCVRTLSRGKEPRWPL
jgi:hypothetical protein